MSKLNFENILEILERGYNLKFENTEYLKIIQKGTTILEVNFFRRDGIPLEETSGIILTVDDWVPFKKVKDIYIEDSVLKVVFEDVSGIEYVAEWKQNDWTW